MTDAPSPRERRIPRDRNAEPDPSIQQSWTPLSDPFVAPNGLVVETVSNVDEMLALGDHFHNALEMRRASEMWAMRIVQGRQHIYRVMAGRHPVSCGELVVKGGRVVLQWDRAHDNRPGTPESQAAAEAFVEAANAGDVRLAYGIEEDGFVFPAASPAP